MTTKPENASSTQGIRILVVDDNEDAALSMSLLLRKRGHIVEVAHDGRQGVDAVPGFKPDLVLMDLGMPTMNGFEACAAMRALDGGDQLRIVALSGWGQDEDRLRSSEAGFNEHVVKPIDMNTLLRIVGNTGEGA